MNLKLQFLSQKEGLEVSHCNLITCRMQLIKVFGINFLNIYAPSGTQGQRARRELFINDL